MYIQIVLKGKRALCGDRSGLIYEIRQTVRGSEKNLWFPYYDFKITNSEWSGNLVFTNFYEFVHTNFVFVCKTSNLFVRIREGFQHVMLQMACTVIINTSSYVEMWHILRKINLQFFLGVPTLLVKFILKESCW